MWRLFLFGAGSSFGSGAVFPYAPPIGANLFADLVAFSPLWANLPNEARLAFQGPDVVFEEGFLWIRENKDELTMPLLNHMALYFLRFQSPLDNLYRAFVDVVERWAGRTVYSTLNYDMLLEDALCSRRGKVAVVLDPQAKYPSVLKLHGGPCFSSTIQLDNFVAIGAEVVVEGPAEVINRAKAIERWQSDITKAPAMALYTRAKNVLVCREFISAIQTQYSRVAAHANEIYVIGANYVEYDTHVWQPLVTTSAKIYVVNPNPAAFEPFLLLRDRRPTSIKCLRFDQFVHAIQTYGESWADNS